MKEYQQRQEAVNRYLQGEKVATIARLMGKSRKWVHHWIKRYKKNPDAANWFESESKAPKMEKSLIVITLFRLNVTIVFCSKLTTHFRFKLTTPERYERAVVLAA